MIAARITAALSLIVALAALSTCMTGPDEIQAARDTAELVQALEFEHRKAVADGGIAKCAQHGRVPFWTTDGDLVCRMPVKANVQVAGGGL